MAVSIEKGTIYSAAMVRTGVSQRGDWEMVKVKEKGKEITIWPDNKPTGLEDGSEFEVIEITSVKYGARKRQDGQWHDDVSVTATLKPAKTQGFGFTIDDMDTNPFDSDLPFNISEEDKLPL